MTKDSNLGGFQETNFIIQNGSIESNADYPLFIGDSMPTSNVTLENQDINGVNIYNTTNIIIRNCTFAATTKVYYAIWADNGTSNIVVESGNFLWKNSSFSWKIRFN